MIGDRMRQARLAAGLTLDEVAGKLAELGQPITKQGLSKYEHNRSTPKAPLLLKLAQVVGVKSSYFLEQPDVQIEWLAFRKHPQLAPARQAQIKAAAMNVAEGQFWLQSTLFPQRKMRLPRAHTIRSFADAEVAAESLRKTWALGSAPIESVTRTIEDAGAIVVGWQRDEGKFDGLAGWLNRSVPLIVLNTRVPSDRRRFSLAHELKHLVSEREQDVSDERDEALAHRFAGAFLVPADVARRELGAKRRHLSLEELGILKCKYGLSMAAWLHRALDLDIIDQGQYNSLRAEMARHDWTVREPVESEAPEEPARLKQMTLRALAEGVITEEKALQLCPGCVEPTPLARPKGRRYTATELMKLPFAERERILAESAAEAAEEYRTNPALTEFEAFGDDDFYDEYPE